METANCPEKVIYQSKWRHTLEAANVKGYSYRVGQGGQSLTVLKEPKRLVPSSPETATGPIMSWLSPFQRVHRSCL
jgi:hypothetical protein